MVTKTILFSIIVVAFCLLGLSIGLILTGKPKLKKGCGSFPKSEKCDKGSCEVCSKKSEKKNH